jgi:hypothetical protein
MNDLRMQGSAGLLTETTFQQGSSGTSRSGGYAVLLKHCRLSHSVLNEILDIRCAFPALATGIHALPQGAQIAHAMLDYGFPNLAFGDVPTDANIHKHEPRNLVQA